jgi:hypothetical protein
MRQHFLLGEVSKVLGRKPHHVTHALTTGQVAEPEQRLGNKRLFTADDIQSLARHFRVTPDWSAVDAAPTDSHAKPPEGLALRPPFEVIRVGETCHEIKDGGGEVFGWTTDRGHALVVAGLLEAAARG